MRKERWDADRAELMLHTTSEITSSYVGRNNNEHEITSFGQKGEGVPCSCVKGKKLNRKIA